MSPLVSARWLTPDTAEAVRAGPSGTFPPWAAYIVRMQCTPASATIPAMARKGALAAAPARSRPAARLRRPDIAAAGVAIADREGIDAVSMRRVAAALGAGTMSLYRHVADRGDLLDAMVEAVYAAAELPASPGVDWRPDVAPVADAP